MSIHTGITLAGFAVASLGLWLLWGWGVTLLVTGLVLFVSGGLGSAREGR